MNRLLLYNNLLTQIRERQKKLAFLRNMIRQMEETGKPVHHLRRELLNLLIEIKNLQYKIRQTSS